MSIRDSHNKKVSFDTRGELGVKIDKLAVMIGKLVTRDSAASRQFKPEIHQGRGRGQNRGNYDRCTVTISKAIRTDIGHIVETEDNIDRTEVGLGMNKIKRRSIFRGNARNFDRQNNTREYSNNYRE